MSGFLRLEASLRAVAGDQLTALRTVGPDQVHLVVDAPAVPPMAAALREQFGAELALMVGDDRRLTHGRYDVHYLFAQARENWFVHASAPVAPDQPAIASLAALSYPASRFEREIYDLFGIHATGHPDPRPLVRHGFWPDDYFPLRKDAGRPTLIDDGRPFPFGQVRGEGVFEIPVGPVHAGVIEPGHFRFSMAGETIIDMKARLYFTHKGTEKLFEGRVPDAGVELAERISGDTTAGHAMAFCQALEAGTGIEIPERARYLRVILLELERLYNHVADVGAIVSDTGFAVAQSHGLRLRERLLALNKRVTGSRLLRGVLQPGGVRLDLPRGLDLVGQVTAVAADFQSIVDICLENTLVADRLDGTGRLLTATARDHGVLGFVARASGIDRDVRRDHPCAAYRALQFQVPVLTSGDVKARALVRIEEVRQSVSLIEQAAGALPAGPLAVPVPPLPPFEPAFALVEGWRGAITHWLMGNAEGRLHRVKVLDPSFLNWPPLSYALLGNIAPDFPLCNKSFNQSYSGNDL
jgi:Ni,Fe-hydrogenase III large subunit/Ni,Fe-hydrogenase III component G